MARWIPIDKRPLLTGKYLVGHRGYQEIMHFFGPEREWMPGTAIGWHRLTDKGWVRDEPAERFRATHCQLITPPPKPSTARRAKKYTGPMTAGSTHTARLAKSA